MTTESNSEAQDNQTTPSGIPPQPSAFEAQGYPRQQGAPLSPMVERQFEGQSGDYSAQSLTVEAPGFGASQDGETPSNAGFNGTSQPFQKVTYSQVKLGPGSGLAFASLIIGFIALILSWVPFLNVIFIAAGIVGAILGIISLAKGEPSRAVAITGLILSILAIFVALGINFLVAWVGAKLWGLVS